MDLMISVIILFVIYISKVGKEEPTKVVKTTVINESGIEEEIEVNESSLVIGKNLMLLREPRAYHKILDELGLGK